MKVAIYPGSFDPITNGHLDIIIRSAKIVDRLIIAVSKNNKKKTLFEINERVEMIKAGIIDPVLVTKSALKNAVSVVTTIISADCVISNMRMNESN